MGHERGSEKEDTVWIEQLDEVDRGLVGDRRIPAHDKGNSRMVIVHPVMLYDTYDGGSTDD